jgi:putative nucleotidyltransferase with HDIG domain
MKHFFSYLRNHYPEIAKVLLFLAALIVLVLIFPREGRFQYEFMQGKPWMHDDLIAPYDFAILKSAPEVESEKNKLMETLQPFFLADDAFSSEQREKLISFFNSEWSKKYRNEEPENKDRNKSLRISLMVYDSILATGVVENVAIMEGKPADFQVNLIRDNVIWKKKWGDLFTIRTADLFIREAVASESSIDKALVINVLENMLVQNIKFDKETTEKEKENLFANISASRGLIQAGERIVSRGELISPEKFQVLESLRIDYESRLGISYKFAGIVFGQIILLAISMISLFLFLYFFRKEIFAQAKYVIMLLLLIVAAVYGTVLVVRFNPDYVYLIPICLIPIVVGVFTDSRLALFSHLITIIITGFLVPNSYEFVFLQLFAGIVTILSTVRLERRSQFFLTSTVIFLTYSVIYLGMTLIREGTLHNLNYQYFGLFAGSAILTLFSYPLIFIFERIFGLITNVTLLELSNTNNKLLRELALKAPGTFQHSLQMANLAEEAIYEIGGNPLLVRTGAMYHDIGKISDPMYFVENQTTGLNPHDDLTNEESAGIIVEHVMKGVERAKKYKLPEQIIDFIRTHHGTRQAEYFYRLAQKENPLGEVDAKDYSYPGPEPFSKETAVLMMADAVEAASRSLSKPDEDAIDRLVEALINNQIENHQFDNADITFRDIRKVKGVFKKKLMNIYHLRIEYPR